VAAIFVNELENNEQSLKRTAHRCFLPRFGSFGKVVSEKKIFRNGPIRKKNCLWRTCLLTDRGQMNNLYREPSIDASYQVSVHMAKRFQQRKFLEIDQSETGIDWQTCLLMNRNEMSSFYRGPPIEVSYQVLVHLTKRFQRRSFLRNRSIRNKNCLWRPCLLGIRDQMGNLYRGPPIDASYQFRFILPSSFRGKDLTKSANQKQELPVAAMFVNGSGRIKQFA
jgi:hypothetical protein